MPTPDKIFLWYRVIYASMAGQDGNEIKIVWEKPTEGPSASNLENSTVTGFNDSPPF